MSHKTTRVICNSRDSLTPIRPRQQRMYTITPLGYKWLEWDKQQQTKELPMDKLPHRDIKAER